MTDVVREPLQVTSFDGHRVGAFLHRPPKIPAPGLVMIPEIFGINLPLREIAARYASEGFVVLTLDVFSRLERDVDEGYDEAGHAKGRALHKAFDYATGVKDMQAAITHLRALPECNGHVGVVGFCLGGTMAYLAASRTDAEAAVGYYGTRIHLFTEEGKEIAKPLILHFGELDHTTPPELLQGQILPAIAGNPNIQAFVYPGMVHAFANHRRPDTYDEAVTKVADARTFAHFRKWLEPERLRATASFFGEAAMATIARGTGRNFAAAVLAGSLGWAVHAGAQDFPQRPITFVVGLGAGGAQDANSRIYAEAMSRSLGQRIVVDNKTGAGGGVAAAYVQNAAPDGYTLLTVSGLQHFYVPATQPGLYEPIKGFAPVSLMFEIISTLAVPEEMPVNNVPEFIAYGRNKPGGLTLGAPGPGSPPHMFGELIAEATGMPVRAVQYRGSTQAMADLAGGRIDMAFPTYGIGAPFIAQKKVKPIAVAADKRWDVFPELPTLKEAGLVKHMVAMWFGLLAPAGTPAPIIAKLNEEVAKASHDPDLVKRLTATGTSIRVSAPDEMRSMMASEATNVDSMIKQLGLGTK